jgi:hypothetical protein
MDVTRLYPAHARPATGQKLLPRIARQDVDDLHILEVKKACLLPSQECEKTSALGKKTAQPAETAPNHMKTPKPNP